MSAERVYLDCFDADEIPEEMFLRAEWLEPDNWNGFAVPVVTWNAAGIVEGDGALVYEDECGRTVWTIAGMVDGSPVYALDGWMWWRADDWNAR